MKIDWDLKIYNSMSSETRRLCDEVKSWLIQHKRLSSKYIEESHERHPALWFSDVMAKVEDGIDNKEVNAVDLGCLYVINAKKAPFGKIHKGNVLVRLKRNKELIKQVYIEQLTATLDSFNQMKYPPREIRELRKLLKFC